MKEMSSCYISVFFLFIRYLIESIIVCYLECKLRIIFRKELKLLHSHPPVKVFVDLAFYSSNEKPKKHEKHEIQETLIPFQKQALIYTLT